MTYNNNDGFTNVYLLVHYITGIYREFNLNNDISNSTRCIYINICRRTLTGVVTDHQVAQFI